MQTKQTSFASINTFELAQVTGGQNRADGPSTGTGTIISPETVGCAVGGAALAPAGPWASAAGCVAGGMVANGMADAVAKDRAGIKPNHPYKPYGY